MLCVTCVIPTREVAKDLALHRHHQLMVVFLQLPAHGPLLHFVPVLVGLQEKTPVRHFYQSTEGSFGFFSPSL